MQRLTQFQAPTRLIFGPDVVEQVGPEAAALRAGKVLVCTDRGVASSGALDKLLGSLKAEGVGYALFDEVEANPSVASVERALNLL